MDEPRSRGWRAFGRRPVVALVRLAWGADRSGVLAIFLASVFEAGAGIGATLAIGALLNSIVGTGGLAGAMPWIALGSVAAIFVIQRVAFPFLAPAVESLEHRLTLLVRERVMTPLLRPSTVYHLEDPKVADELRQAQLVGSENFSAQQALGALNDLTTIRLSALACTVLLWQWHWWAPPVLGFAWLCSRAWYRRQMSTLVASMERNTPPLRRAEYVGDLVLGGTAAKEARVFGLAPWLVERFHHQWLTGMTEVWRQRRQGRVATLFSALVLLGSHLLVLGLLVKAALAGEFAIGQLFVYLQVALGHSGYGFHPEMEYILRMGAAPLPHVLEIDRLVSAGESSARAGGRRHPGDAPQTAVRFEGVYFAYPSTGRPVLNGLDLEIPAGRSLAIVGENGAGKTTIVNLLCGFYQPSLGQITVDGADLAELDTHGWQRRIAAVFQDYARYPVPVWENVTFGAPNRSTEYLARLRAAEKAGLTEVIEDLPKTWGTMLSRKFDGGAELSGGQWQRVALARAMFALECGASILVLDEPTSNLDVRAEAALYNRFLELTAGLTTIIVSHRFSTVRRADRIVVVDGGRIVESGSHDELLALGGRYSRMFRLQARYYDEPAPVATASLNRRRKS